jgi:serine/threonine-protein kinase HipA
LLEIDWRLPSLDYAQMLKAVRRVTRHQADVEKMFARMVFNVVAHNRDDHTKQHAFMMDDAGRWSLAPPFDLTFSAGPGGEHYLAVEGRGTGISRAAIDAVAKREDIEPSRAAAIVDQVVDAVSRFKQFARDHDVSRRTVSEVSSVLDRDIATLTGRSGTAASAGKNVRAAKPTGRP